MVKNAGSGWVVRGIALLVALGLPLVGLVLLTQAAVVRAGEPMGVPPATSPRAGEAGWLQSAEGQSQLSISRVQTVTLIPPPPGEVYTLVQTVWQNDWYGLAGQMWLLFPLDVPTQEVRVVTDPPSVFWIAVAVPISDGLRHEVHFHPPLSVHTYTAYMVYTTSIGLAYEDEGGLISQYRAERIEDTNLVETHIGGWLTFGYDQLTTTLVFPTPYRYVWAAAYTTNVVTTTIEPGADPHWVSWGMRDVYWFRGDVQARDTRLYSDLTIDSLSIDPLRPIAGRPMTVTAVLSNLGDVTPDTYFYTEWYARPPGYGPPQNAGDHDHGWCGDPPACIEPGRIEFLFDAVPSTTGFLDPVYAIRPGHLVTLSRVYALPEDQVYDLYAQVDVDLGEDSPLFGRNLELDDDNNTAALLNLQVYRVDLSASDKLQTAGPTVVGGDLITYTLVSYSDSTIEDRLRIRDYVPDHVTVLTESISASVGTPLYWPDEGAHGMIAWDGVVWPTDRVTLTYQVRVNTTAPDGALVANRAQFIDGGGRIQRDVELTTTVQAPELNRSFKRAGVSSASAGDPLPYRVVARNSGALGGAVELRDVLPGDSALLTGTLSASTGTAVFDPDVAPHGAVLWDGFLAPGALVTITFDVRVHESTITGTILTNTVVFTNLHTGQVITDVIMTGVGVAPDLALSDKTVDREVAYRGDRLTYRLVAHNSGDLAGLVRIEDLVPEHLILLPGSLAASKGVAHYDPAEPPNGLIYYNGYLAVGESLTVTFQAQIDPAITEDMIVTNVARFLDDSTGLVHREAQAMTQVYAERRIYMPVVIRR